MFVVRILIAHSTYIVTVADTVSYSSYPREPPSERSASAPPPAAGTEIKLLIFVIRNDELVSVSDYAVQGSRRSGRDRNA